MGDHRHSDKVENQNSNTSQDEVGRRLLSDAQPQMTRAEQTQVGDAKAPVQQQLDVSQEGDLVKQRFDASPQAGLDQSATRINDLRTSMGNSDDGRKAWDEFVKTAKEHYPADLLVRMGIASDGK